MEISYARNDRIIRRKFYQYLIPTVLMVLAMQFGSLGDAIMVGNFLGADALSATSLAIPVVFFVEVPGFALAVGASIVGANYIGKRKILEAGQVFKLSLLLSFLISLIFIPIGLLFGDGIASLLAGNFTGLTPLIAQYVKVYCYQAPLLAIGLVVAYWLPSDNSPNLGAAFFVIANIIHLAAFAIFALAAPKDVVAGYGVYVAAGCMGLGMLSGLVVLPFYFKSKARTADVKAPWKGAFSHFLGTLKAGSVTGIFTLLSGVFYLIINIAATAFLTEGEMPVFAMLSNFSFVIDLFIVGVLQLMPSVISSLFGEKDYFGIRSVFRRVVLITGAITLILMAVSLIFPQLFFMIFGVDLQETIAVFHPSYGNDPMLVIRVYVISFLFYACNRLLANYYPSIMVNSPGITANIIRLGAIGPALIYVLMMNLGALGYAIGNVGMEALTFGLTIAFVFIARALHKLPGKGILCLPEAKKDAQCLDLSLPCDEQEMSKAVEEIQRYAEEVSKNETAAAMLAVATEEIVSNTIRYGYSKGTKAEYVDINLCFDSEKLILRIRDDGIAFDPTSFSPSEAGEFEFHGIDVVRDVASDFKYLRVLNTNNPVIEVVAAKK